MIILSIESSCDDTAAAVTDGRRVLSSIVASQTADHRIYGGVVPEIASRKHTEAISQVCGEALRLAGIDYGQIEAAAVTFAPGLIGSLLVGVNFAKGLAFSLKVPLIPVHHLRSHVAANYINNPDLQPPFVCLLVSGGNTLIVKVEDYTKFDILGATLDDAAGECFDKAARFMGLPYPGGVMLDKMATAADEKLYPLPFPKAGDGEFDFSFSGLKTAVMNLIHNSRQRGGEVDFPVLAATLRKRVCDILIEKTLKAAQKENIGKIALAGGVSANSELRRRMEEECGKRGLRIYFPELRYCGDNAAMVGVQALYEFESGNTAGIDLNAAATLPINYR